MPPKARITKDVIINAAVEIARRRGYGSISAGTVSGRLRCSAQPVAGHLEQDWDGACFAAAQKGE